MTIERVKTLAKTMRDIDKKLEVWSKKRKVIEETEKELKQERAVLETEQVGEMFALKLKATKIVVGKRTLTVESKSRDIPVIKDKVKFHAYIIKNKTLDMLQSRLTMKAITDRWEDGVKIPGIGKFIKKTIVIKET